MAKKKGKKGKKAEKAKEYQLITMEEVQAREAKYRARLHDLRVCLAYMDHALLAVEVILEQQRIKDKWDIFLRTDGLPKPYSPPELRLFPIKLHTLEVADHEKRIDWLLTIDEHSILTQYLERVDLTRKTLVKTRRPNFGAEYEKYIDSLLQVLKNIEYFLEDEREVAKVSHRVVLDIFEQKTEVAREVSKFFDRYTYRIISSEESYMDGVDPYTSEYCYKSNNFRIHIWAIKDVPILFEFMPEPYMVANFRCLDTVIVVPFSVLEDNLTIRGLHYFFDHCSEKAKSFSQKIVTPSENLTAGIPDLHECLVREYMLQMKIQNDVRNELIRKRLEYEEKVAQIAEIEEQKKKNKGKQDDKKPKKKEKPIKLPKEPPMVPPNMFPDVWDDFLQQENGYYNEFINKVYHPSVLKLTEDELNMKKYFILGGIYQFDFVVKPRHVQFKDFNMTWHENNSELQIKRDVVALDFSIVQKVSRMISQASMAPDSRASRRATTTRKSTVAATGSRWDMKEEEENVEDKWCFIVKVQLPDYLCEWGEPEPYHFEADLTGYVEDIETEAADGESEVRPAHSFSGNLQPTNAPEPTAVVPYPLNKDDGLNTAFQENMGRTLSSFPSRSSTTPRSKRSTINVFLPSTSSYILSLHKMKEVTENLGVDDFRLDIELTLQQIRLIQRYCLPRIISSFKFPVEMQEEPSDDAAKKSKIGGFMRKAGEESFDEIQQLCNFDDQNNPERMFPYFPDPDELNLNYSLKELYEHPSINPQCFSELIDAFDALKFAYKDTSNKTMVVPPLKGKQKLPSTRSFVARASSKDIQFPRRSSKMGSRASISSIKSSRATKSRVTGVRSVIEFKSDFDLSKSKERKEQEKLLREIEMRRAEVASKQEEEEGEEEDSEEEDEDEIYEESEDKRETFKYSHWTNKYIFEKSFDRETFTMTIHTDRLGTIGFAFKRYEHFPFKDWSLEPSPENPENEVLFTLETNFVLCNIYITAKGYRGCVTEPSKAFLRNRKVYLEINEPITDFTELKKRFREKHLNIFSEHDARFYIENGYFSEKHLAAELHTYSCMALHCLYLKFMRSDWNRLASRRDMLLNFVNITDPPENTMQVRITPENATFVDVKELCSNDLNVFNLEYSPTWRNIDTYSDFHHLIMSCYLSALDNRCRDPCLMVNLKNLLFEIRPLSYS